MSGDHTRVTEESFTRQAGQFDDPRLTLADPANLAWMVEAIAPRPTDAILDVASGTGLLALALAGRAARVVSLELVPAMQAAARSKAEAQGLANVAFARGLAEALPFGGGTFDLVACRFAFHHFVAPERVLAELRRVVKPGGAVAVIDLLSPGEGAIGERYDAVERLRDPSHTRALTEAGFAALFAGQGLRVARERHRTVEVSVERWLDLTAPAPGARREVLGAFQAQLSGGPATGFELFRAGDGLRFRQRWAVYVLGG